MAALSRKLVIQAYKHNVPYRYSTLVQVPTGTYRYLFILVCCGYLYMFLLFMQIFFAGLGCVVERKIQFGVLKGQCHEKSV